MAQTHIDYDLDSVKESFNFKLGTLVFNFRYPTTREIRTLSEMNTELQALVDKKASEAAIKKQSKLSEDKMNELVTPVDHENQISEVLEDMPINVVRGFRSMMAKEINLG